MRLPKVEVPEIPTILCVQQPYAEILKDEIPCNREYSLVVKTSVVVNP